MYISSKSVLAEAKTVLSKNIVGNVTTTLLTFSVFLICMFVCDFLSSLIVSPFSNFVRICGFLILFCLIIVPLIFGLLRYFWRCAYSEHNNISELFIYFNGKRQYFRVVRFTIAFFAKIAIYLFFCYLPAILVSFLNATWVFSLMGAEPPVWAAGLESVRFYFSFFGSVIFFLFAHRLYLAPMLAVIDPGMTALEALHTSVTLSKFTLGSYYRLLVRQVGWIIISFLGLPLLYSLPLYFSSYVSHIHECINEYNIVCEQSNRRFFSEYTPEF